MQKGDYLKARDYFNESIKLNPDDIDNYINIAICLRYLCQHEEALNYLQKALSINQKDPDIFLNKGVLLREMMMIDEAIIDYRKAIELKPDFSEAYYNLSLAFLLKGDYKKGWSLYQRRWQTEDFQTLPQPIKKWNGKIGNFTLLLLSEQGLGDTIQFIRYAKYLSDRGIAINFKSQPPLVSLLEGQCGISSINSKIDYFISFNYDCYLLDLPYFLKTQLNSIPSEIPYIFAKEFKINKFTNIIKDEKKLKIGVCWRGSKTNQRTISRSIDIELLKPILSLNKDITFYSLQLSDSINELYQLPVELRPVDLSSFIDDFSDTSAIIHHMDIIITIDSSIAHLAGAMGKKTLLLLNYSSDWRWLMDRNDSPWYPTINIFRQDKLCDWTKVVSDVRAYLSSLT